MKAIVVYTSNTGFTKKYAEWIASALGCYAVTLEKAKGMDFGGYDALVYGGWLFAESVKGLKEFKDVLNAFDGKKVVFATGASPCESTEAQKALSDNLSEQERKTTATFYLRGGLDYENMKFAHKQMMKVMCSMMKKKHGEDSEVYRMISKSFDGTDKKAVQPIIDYIEA